MENKFIPDAIEIVGKAITADNEGEYEKALNLYRDALGRFTMGLKYEKNESRKKLIIERVEGYMKRAEELRDYINKQQELESKGGGGAASKKKGEGDDEDDSKEKSKLRGALSNAIVTEKPNIKWDDVAGLEGAKDSLKEVRFVPFHLCVGLYIGPLVVGYLFIASRTKKVWRSAFNCVALYWHGRHAYCKSYCCIYLIAIPYNTYVFLPLVHALLHYRP